MERVRKFSFVVLWLAYCCEFAPLYARPFSVLGVFSAGGESYVCLQPSNSDRSAWVTVDDELAGWWVQDISLVPPRKVVLEAADGQVIEMVIEYDNATSPLPPSFDSAWINSAANPMSEVLRPAPDIWAQRWSRIVPEERNAILLWYRNHGLGIDITVQTHGYEIATRRLVRDDVEQLRERREAFEQSLSPEQRAEYGDLMAAQARANRPVRIDRPGPGDAERVEPPGPEAWRKFAATLSEEQATNFHRLLGHRDRPSTLEQLEDAGWGGTPTAEVHRALAALRQQMNYAWQTISSSGTVEQPTDPQRPPADAFRPPPLLTDAWIAWAAADPRRQRSLGWFDRDGFSVVKAMEGGTGAWVEGVTDRDRSSVVLTPRGWLSVEECLQAARTEGTDRISFGGTDLPRNLCFTIATTAARTTLPEDELAALVTQSRPFRIVGDSHVAELKRRYLDRLDVDESASNAPVPSGVLVVRIADGTIVEFHLITRLASVIRDRVVFERVNERHTRISEQGSTVVQIPVEARAKLAALSVGDI